MVNDLAGMSQMTALGNKGFLMAPNKVLSDHYPETMGKILFLNPPWTFKVFLNFLPRATRSKMEVVSGDPLPTLERHMERKWIPEEYGG